MNDDVMITAYRHDAHKMNGTPHRHAPKTFAGVAVNRTVPHNADGDASALSRPDGKPEQTVENHETPYRLSLIEGESPYNSREFTRDDIESTVRELLTEDDAEIMHRKWLDSNATSVFPESRYYPYTSLKYHTLLVAALLDNYRVGREFADLKLVVDDAEQIVPYRTVYTSKEFDLRIDADPRGHPSAPLGDHPWRSWMSVWNRLASHSLDTTHETHDMVLDANLRRIGAWSTALQYIEDFRKVFGR